MRSPVGWALANVFYDKHVGMPESGSWQEALMLLTWAQRQLSRSTESKLLTQAIMSADDEKNGFKYVLEAQEDHLEALFPYYRQQQKERQKEQLALLQRWTSLGPISIQPMTAPLGEVRERKLLARGQQAQQQRAADVESGKLVRLSSRMWRERVGAVPIRVGKARRPV